METFKSFTIFFSYIRFVYKRYIENAVKELLYITIKNLLLNCESVKGTAAESNNPTKTPLKINSFVIEIARNPI